MINKLLNLNLNIFQVYLPKKYQNASVQFYGFTNYSMCNNIFYKKLDNIIKIHNYLFIGMKFVIIYNYHLKNTKTKGLVIKFDILIYYQTQFIDLEKYRFFSDFLL